MGPPEHVAPGVALLELMLVNVGRHTVWIGHADVYPSGLALRVDLHGREPAPPGLESGPGTWRFGVQFSDGRKATSFGLGAFSVGGGGTVAASVSRAATAVARGHGGSSPEGPLLRPQGGAGSRTVWRQGYWLWPLPPPGDLLIACEWPNAGIELTTATFSADVLRDAASRAQELWPPPDAPE
jgi:hypothetical protein